MTDGPFVEAKEFIAGFDLIECADLDECIAMAATAPVARFMAVEIRPFATLRVREGEILLADGPFFTTGEYIAAIDVVSCADQEQAVQLATTHPAARSHPIEVRPFENE